MLSKEKSSKCTLKPNKISIDKSSEFQNRSMNSRFQYSKIEMHSNNSKGKYVANEKFIRALTNKTNKNVNSVTKKCVY